VGGAAGLSAEFLQRADWVWSLSRLTWPHEMVPVLVAEQLYRAYTIQHGHPYHKG
jgi:23S rRNA (pseudouridine1915-N3)-methyltransferase